MLPVLMKEYFPSVSTKESDQIWTRIRHSNLSIDEQTELTRCGENCKAFLVKARKWEKERAEYFASLG